MMRNANRNEREPRGAAAPRATTLVPLNALAIFDRPRWTARRYLGTVIVSDARGEEVLTISRTDRGTTYTHDVTADGRFTALCNRIDRDEVPFDALYAGVTSIGENLPAGPEIDGDYDANAAAAEIARRGIR